MNGIRIMLSRSGVEEHLCSRSSDLTKLVSDFAGMLASHVSIRF